MLDAIVQSILAGGDAALDASTDGALKGAHDALTDKDKASRAAILALLGSLGIPIIAEEQDNPQVVPDTCLVIDELDGSIVASHGYDHYALSIAHKGDGVISAGAIFQPARNLLIGAEFEKGCWISEDRGETREPVSLRDYQKPLAETLVLAEVGHALNTDLCEHVLIPLSLASQLMKRPCSSVACVIDLLLGHTGAIVNVAAAKIWDFAAGALAVQEAGGVFKLWNGITPKWDTIPMDVVMGANGAIFMEVVESITNWRGTGRDIRPFSRKP